ncbi:MAG: hypothetical protein N3I35_16190 [Clostridia bacterium]|nr:hypothetical protein [Clostridia bacterium]
MKINKIVVILLVVLLIRGVTLLALSGKPVKLATFNTSKGETSSGVPYGKVTVICEYTQVTGARWMVVGYNDKKVISIGENEFISITGKSPDQELSEEIMLYETNTFVIRGRLVKNDNPTEENDSEKLLIADSWDIVYPIKRADSIPRLFPPRFYLSSRDFK